MPPHSCPSCPSTLTHRLPCTHAIHTRLPHCTPSCWPLSASPSCRICLRYRAESRLYTALRSGASNASRRSRTSGGGIDPLEVESQIRRLHDELAAGAWPRRVRRAEYEVWKRLGDVGLGVWVGEVEGRVTGEREIVGRASGGRVNRRRGVEMVERDGEGGRQLGGLVREGFRLEMVERVEAGIRSLGEMVREGLGGWDASELEAGRWDAGESELGSEWEFAW
ncbi:hypothetical protein MMC27_005496 [Xylographa pallens]|nr:hypothetical protein [Xylographa pallens]